MTQTQCAVRLRRPLDHSCDLLAVSDKVTTCPVRLSLARKGDTVRPTALSCNSPNLKITLLHGARRYACYLKVCYTLHINISFTYFPIATLKGVYSLKSGTTKKNRRMEAAGVLNHIQKDIVHFRLYILLVSIISYTVYGRFRQVRDEDSR